MKKLLLILAIALTGCSKDEIQEEEIQIVDTCNCFEQTWVRTSLNGNLISDWYWNGAESFYSDDCEDDELVTGGYSGDINGLFTEIQYRVVCY